MKIRIRGQSIRLRLGQSEVSALADGRAVEESILFAPGVRFTAAIRPDATAVDVRLAADAGLVVIHLPRSRIDAWAGTDAVGISADLPVGDGESLRVLIEKDFVCLDNESGESQADAFPNPSAVCR